jgi:hypothetical protein
MNVTSTIVPRFLTQMANGYSTGTATLPFKRWTPVVGTGTDSSNPRQVGSTHPFDEMYMYVYLNKWDQRNSLEHERQHI